MEPDASGLGGWTRLPTLLRRYRNDPTVARCVTVVAGDFLGGRCAHKEPP
jgi:hypothetical protein